MRKNSKDSTVSIFLYFVVLTVLSITNVGIVKFNMQLKNSTLNFHLILEDENITKVDNGVFSLKIKRSVSSLEKLAGKLVTVSNLIFYFNLFASIVFLFLNIYPIYLRLLLLVTPSLIFYIGIATSHIS